MASPELSPKDRAQGVEPRGNALHPLSHGPS